jgi:cytochrome c oxidase subunit 3
MATVPLEHVGDEGEWRLPTRGMIAMACLITAESSIFTIFVVAYLYNLGRDVSGPTPKEVLEVPIWGTACLLSSSGFVMLAEHAIEHGKLMAFRLWWLVTIGLGMFFLADTGLEWQKLIVHDHLTIHTNLFGTCFYSLVGLHASHVVVGLLMMLITLVFALTGHVRAEHTYRIKVLALYWHFVDAVWVVVFTVVYLVGR